MSTATPNPTSQRHPSVLAAGMLCLLVLFAASARAGDSDSDGPPSGTTDVEGYVTHGINVYNDRFIADYSAASPAVFWLNPALPIMEIGVLSATPGAADAERITAETDPDLPLATIRSFADVFNPAGTYDPELFNRTLDEIGTSFFGFAELTERVRPVAFDAAHAGDIYLAAGTRPRPTVGEWSEASGLLRYRCRDDGSAVVQVALRDAMPNAVYTLWDIGVHDPLTAAEEGYAAPFGGIPNVLLTDADGCGYRRIETPFCPGRPCAAGADSCTSYVSAFLHWDHQVYGGAPAATFAGMPIGAIASNHVMWPLSGTPLQEPVNPFQARDLRCPR